MSELVGTIALYTGFVAFFWELSTSFFPKDKHRRYTVVLIVLYLVVVLLLVLNRLSFVEFFTQNSGVVLLSLSLVVAIFSVVLSITIKKYNERINVCNETITSYHKKLQDEEQYWNEKIQVKEYFATDTLNNPVRITIDAKRHCGSYYFNGRCLLLPAGTYQLTADPDNPGGWSAWDSDKNRYASQFDGSWTWNLLISIPGQTEDFDTPKYYMTSSYQKAMKMGRWEDSWIFPSKQDITFTRLKNSGFDTELVLELSHTAPVWFWIWDQSPGDNRGEVNILLSKTF